MTTLTTTAVYQEQTGVLLPKVKPHFSPKEVVVVYVGQNDEEEDEVELSPEWEAMLAEAQAEVKRGDVIGPFDSVEEAIQALHRANP